MSNVIPIVELFGSENCHKTELYTQFLSNLNIHFIFHDVEQDERAARRLRSYYESGKLNYPTILIGTKKLRNPTSFDLMKNLIKANIVNMNFKIVHDEKNRMFKLPVGEEGQFAYVQYKWREGTMYLVHSEVPLALRGQGVGRRLVEKTKEYLDAHSIEAIPTCGYIRYIYGKLYLEKSESKDVK